LTVTSATKTGVPWCTKPARQRSTAKRNAAPSPLCSDRGRAINSAEPGWAGTLRGEAAEIYLRWERDLKPNGFQFSARVPRFPGRHAGRHRPVPDTWGE
jgi:hypothetical protein